MGSGEGLWRLEAREGTRVTADLRFCDTFLLCGGWLDVEWKEETNWLSLSSTILRFLETGKEKGEDETGWMSGELFRELFAGLLRWEGTRGRMVTLTAGDDDDDDESDDGDEKKS